MKRKSKGGPVQPRTRTVARRTSRADAPGAKTSGAKTSRAPASRHKAARPKSSREKVKAYRERMRRRGMKLIQIWVPDPTSPYFFAEARRQARLIAESPYEKEDQAFIDSISEWKPI
jgi:hypothetical protein